jgi:hypothetical protein
MESKLGLFMDNVFLDTFIISCNFAALLQFLDGEHMMPVPQEYSQMFFRRQLSGTVNISEPDIVP